MLKGIAFALAAAAAGAALGQTEVKRNPSDPAAPAPKAEYRSAFKGYQPYAEPQLAPWRALNEEVARGDGAHAGDTQPADQAKKPAPKPPAEAGHGAHK
jgi:hypothetical protein